MFQVVETETVAVSGDANAISGTFSNIIGGAIAPFMKPNSSISDVNISSSVNNQKVHTIPGAWCSLYMPGNLVFTDGVQYDDFSLGVIGATTEGMINAGGSISSAIMGGAKAQTDMIGSIKDFFNNNTSNDAARYAAIKIAKTATFIPGLDKISGGIHSALQTATNPNKRLLFREVNLREFSFSFKLIPNSAAEAAEIKKIIKFFRTELYPEDNLTLSSGVVAGYKFPNKFRITFKHRDTEVAYKILDSHLVTVSTSFNNTGAGFFEDGNFTETDVSLVFREATTLNKQKIGEGY